jgi:hypothetical protein
LGLPFGCKGANHKLNGVGERQREAGEDGGSSKEEEEAWRVQNNAIHPWYIYIYIYIYMCVVFAFQFSWVLGKTCSHGVGRQ